MKKKIFCCIIVLISLICCSCNIANPDLSQKISVEFYRTENCSILEYSNGKMIFQTLENPTRFFSLDVGTKKEEELGEISNFVLNGYSRVTYAGQLYTSVTVTDNNGELLNVLYAFDYNNASIKPIYSDNGYSPIVYLYKEPRGILQLKTPKVGSTQTTFFELYNISTSATEIVLMAQDNEIFVIASVYENKLYVLSAIEKPDSSYSFSLKEYNMTSYQVTNEIKLDSIYDYLINSRIGKMEVFGNYVYFQNYSNMGVICSITETSVSPVIERESLEYAGIPQSSSYEKEVLFYIRNTAECFTINRETGDIRTIEPKIHSGYNINCVFIDENNILLVEKQSSVDKRVSSKTMLNIYSFEDIFRN